MEWWMWWVLPELIIGAIGLVVFIIASIVEAGKR